MTAATTMVETVMAKATVMVTVTATVMMLPLPLMAMMSMMMTAAFKDGNWMMAIG
jgi:hypothetical protein